MASTAPSFNQEVAYRVGEARTACAALSRSILGAKSLDARLRGRAASACVDTRALYSAGTWDPLSTKQLAKLEGALGEPLRRICGQHRPPQYGERLPDADACRRQLRVAPMRALLAAHALRYVARVAAHGPDVLLAMLQSKAAVEWVELVMVYLEWVQAVLGRRLSDLGPPRTNLACWWLFWQRFPGRWRELIRIFFKQASRPSFRIPFVSPSLPPQMRRMASGCV